MGVILAMVGKYCNTVAFETMYLYSAELFPTGVRNIGIGTVSSVGRLGGILAPYINLLVIMYIHIRIYMKHSYKILKIIMTFGQILI